MRALIVDDSHTARLVVAFHLEALGYETQQAMDGSSALEALRQGYQADLMTLDWNMPGLSGGQVLEELTRHPELRPGKVMVVTSETEMLMVDRAIGRGCDEYLMKPFTADAMREKLEIMGLPIPAAVTIGED